MPVKRISSDLKKDLTIRLENSRDESKLIYGTYLELGTIARLIQDESFWQEAAVEPKLIRGFIGFYKNGQHHFLREQFAFQNYAYRVDGEYSDHEKSLLVQNAFDSERREFEHLRLKFGGECSAESRSTRPRIPEAIRIAVWRRDGGVCVRCGSRDRLEYDHIIPIVRGGSNTARNIELLCESCNRSKGGSIM